MVILGSTVNRTRLMRIVLAAVFLALCVVGANVKLMGSIALDSFAAFLGAIVLGPVDGAVLGFFGHMISALLAGFPLTLPIHLIIGVLMAICMAAFGYIRKRFGRDKLSAILVSDVIAYVINVPLELVLMYPLLKGTIVAFFLPLTIATIVNLVICEILYKIFAKRLAPFMGDVK